MKFAKTFLSILLTALYLFFPGNGLSLVNHVFLDKGLPETECSRDSKSERNADYSLCDDGDHSSFSDSECTCAHHIPKNADTFEHNVSIGSMPFFEKVHFLPEVYYPIIVPPQNPTV